MEPKLLTASRFVDQRTGIMYRYILSDTEYFRPHFHDYCEVFLVLDGNAVHMVNGDMIHLRPRDMVFIRPSDTHDYAAADGKPFSMLNITFTSETLDGIFSYLGEGFSPHKLTDAKLPPSVRLTFGEFDAFKSRMQAVSAIPPDDAASLKTALRVVLFEIFTRYFSDFAAHTETAPAWLEELCAQMRRDGNFIDGSERLFSIANKRREHVCRSMKKYMGLTVSEFINDLRLTYIANMLKNSNHTVTEIIFESGFNNISWASELFKKKYGTTMGRFRKS